MMRVMQSYTNDSDGGRPNRQPASETASNHAGTQQFAGFDPIRRERTQESDRIELQPRSSDFLDVLDKADSRSVHSDLFHKISAAMPDLQKLSASARAATRAEQRLTFLGACRLYPKAIAWSVLLSSTIIMEGFDTSLIYSFFTLPVFRQAYGAPLLTPGATNGQQPNFQISPSWQSGLTNGATVGEIIGLFVNGHLADRLGYRRTMIIALVLLSLSVFLAFFAVSIEMLLVAQIMCGIPWGIFQTLSTTYAAEVMPVTLRAYLLSNINMCWLLGQIIGVGIMRALIHTTSEWAYRIPFGLQWGFALPILVGVFFAPESPWWLIRHERPEEARKALLRLTQRGREDFNVDEAIAMMKHTNEVEKHLGTRGMTYLDCFRRTDLRRTEIACMVWITQQFCGSSLSAYAAYFYEQAGFAIDNSFNFTVGMYGLAIVGGIISWFLLPSIGRRRLYLCGLLASVIILVTNGVFGALPAFTAQPWILGSLIVFLTFIYDLTIGPVCYVLVAEIPSTRLRVKTVVLARVAYNIANIVTNVITPHMLNPTAWNWKGKACLFYAGTALVCLLWCYFRLPELFGLSYLEIDVLFERRAKASKFHEFQARLANTGYFNLAKFERQAEVWRGY